MEEKMLTVAQRGPRCDFHGVALCLIAGTGGASCCQLAPALGCKSQVAANLSPHGALSCGAMPAATR